MSMMLNPRRETMKEIIEADTDPMKEVLWPGATFVPTPTQKKLANLTIPRLKGTNLRLFLCI